MNNKVLDELSQVLDEIDTSKSNALIITGERENSFVAGADISEISSSKKEAEEFSIKGNKVFRKIETLEIPVIAAINGFALGWIIFKLWYKIICRKCYFGTTWSGIRYYSLDSEVLKD